jgi:hypothetical protein
MATAMALVRSARGGVADALIELFSVPADFQSRRPVRDRAQLATLKLERLGSGISDADSRVRIVLPLDAMHVEALPGTHPILEKFKLLHRQIDAANTQENLRLKKTGRLRYAQRLLADERRARHVGLGDEGARMAGAPIRFCCAVAAPLRGLPDHGHRQ